MGEFLTPDFVHKYIYRMRAILEFYRQDEILAKTGGAIHLSFVKPIQQISKIILESEQGSLFLQLISHLPEHERSQLIPSANTPEKIQGLLDHLAREGIH